ncbi:MAG: DUF4097 family beta strand repeat-containing protein [Oscillospiraceae bacterium]
MKNKFLKKATLIATISTALVILGTIIALVGFGMADFNIQTVFEAGEKVEKVSASYSLEEANVSDVFVDIVTANVKIQQSESDSLELLIYDKSIEHTIKDGKLLVTQNMDKGKKRRWYNLFDGTTEHSELVINLPKSFTGSIDTKLKYGDLDIHDINSVLSITNFSTNGSVWLENFNVSGNLALKSNYGETSLKGINITGDASLESKNGNTNLDKFTAKNISLNSQYGDIEIAEFTATSLDIKNENGNIKLEECVIATRLNTTSKYGDIVFEALSSPSINITANSGEVRGDVLGSESEYRISANVLAGDTNLISKDTGDKELKIFNKYGNVKVDFSN